MSNSEICEGDGRERGMMEGVVEGGVRGRGKPYGSSTNVLNYKSGGELVDCQVGLQAGPPCWKRNGPRSSSTFKRMKTPREFCFIVICQLY